MMPKGGEVVRLGLYVVPTEDELRERAERLEHCICTTVATCFFSPNSQCVVCNKSTWNCRLAPPSTVVPAGGSWSDAKIRDELKKAAARKEVAS